MVDLVPRLDRVYGPVSVLSAYAPKELRAQHGCYVLEESEGNKPRVVRKLDYAGKHGDSRENLVFGENMVERGVDREGMEREKQGGEGGFGEFHLVCGMVYFDVPTCKDLLNLTLFPPFDCCTYLGIDDGGVPVRLSLYLDIIRAMLPETKKEDLLISTDLGVNLRDTLWRELHGKYRVVTMETTEENAVGTERFRFIHSAKDYVRLHTSPQEPFVASAKHQGFTFQRRNHAFIEGEDAKICSSAVVVNSLLPQDIEVSSCALVEHCVCPRGWCVGAGSLCSGIRGVKSALSLPPQYVFQQLEIEEGKAVYIFFHQEDCRPVTLTNTFCGKSVEEVLHSADIAKSELWQNGVETSFAHAKLFPVLSLDESATSWPLSFSFLWSRIAGNPSLHMPEGSTSSAMSSAWKEARRLSLVDIAQRFNAGREFAWRQEVSQLVNLQLIRQCLVTRQDINLRPLYTRIAKADYWELFPHLDAIAADPSTSSDVAARVLAHIGDALATFAPPNTGGIRSGKSTYSPSLSLCKLDSSA